MNGAIVMSLIGLWNMVKALSSVFSWPLPTFFFGARSDDICTRQYYTSILSCVSQSENHVFHKGVNLAQYLTVK